MRMAVLALCALSLTVASCGRVKMPGAEEAAQAQANLDAGKAFMEKVAKEEGVKAAPRGIYYEIEETPDANAPSPKPTDTVKIHYHGTLLDGSVFDSSLERGVPAVFPLPQLVECWKVAVPLMKKGETATLYCPADTAYGEMPRPGIPGNSTLIFKIQLIDFQ